MPSNEIVELILRAKDMASGAVNGVRGGMEKLQTASDKYNSTVQRLTGSANEFRNTLRNLAAVVGVAGVARSFVEINSSAEKTKLMLEGLMGSTEKANEAFQWLLDFSTKAPFSIDAMKDAFIKLQVAGLDPMSGSLQVLTDSIAAFGGGDEELKSAAIAIEQMAGKGVISMEELRQQLGEKVPTAMKAMADALGMSMAQMDKEISSGNISAEKGLKALFGKLQEMYGGQGVKMMDSWTGLVSNLRVTWEKLMLTIGNSGVFEKLKTILDGLLKKIDEMKSNGQLEVWADRIATTVSSLITLFLTLAGIFGKVIDAIGPMLPAIITVIAYMKTFQFILGGVVGLPMQLASKIFGLVDAFRVLSSGTGIMSFFRNLIAQITASTAAATALGIALKATLIGAAIWAAVEIGKFIVNLVKYRKEIEKLKQINADQAAEQEYQNQRAEKYNKILQELGFKTMKEFNAAVKDGTVAFNEQTVSWEKVSKAAEKHKKTYEEVLASIKDGSAQYLNIKGQELKTLKANIDYETAMYEQQYKNGEISLQQFLDIKKQLQADYTDRVIALKQKEMDALLKDPEANVEKIRQTEEEIKQIRIQSAADQLKTEQDLTDGLKKTQEDAFKNWQSLQELKLQSLQGKLDLQNTIEEAAVKSGLMRQSALLQNQLARLEQYYQAKIDLATETAERIAETEGTEGEAYIEAVSQREQLQRELEAKIIESEANIGDAVEREMQEAQAFIGQYLDNRVEQVQLAYDQELKALEDYYAQGLVSEEDYEQARLEIVNKFNDLIIKAQATPLVNSLQALFDAFNQKFYKLHNIIDDMANDPSWDNVRQSFHDVTQAINMDWATMNDQMTTYQDLSWKKLWGTLTGGIADSMRQLFLYGKDVTDMSAEQVEDWAQRVRDYVGYVQDLFASLESQIVSWQDELDRMRGNYVAIVERWYREELAKLKEKYGEELRNTKEYEEALLLLKQLYNEKMSEAEEQMARNSADTSNSIVNHAAETAKGLAQGVRDSVSDIADSMKDLGFDSSHSATVTKEVRLDSYFEIQTFDQAATERWAKNILFPMWERYLKLKGQTA
jgi:tape measure domain-containing protein